MPVGIANAVMRCTSRGRPAQQAGFARYIGPIELSAGGGVGTLLPPIEALRCGVRDLMFVMAFKSSLRAHDGTATHGSLASSPLAQRA